MDKAKLQERLKLIEDAIKNLNAELNQKVADLNMLEGGKQEILFWCQELGKMPE